MEGCSEVGYFPLFPINLRTGVGGEGPPVVINRAVCNHQDTNVLFVLMFLHSASPLTVASVHVGRV